MYIAVIAYAVNFVRTIFVVAVIYLVIRLFSRYILPYLIHKGVKNMQEKMEEQNREQQRQDRREGDITVERKPGNRSGKSSDEGEYVDFEEVE